MQPKTGQTCILLFNFANTTLQIYFYNHSLHCFYPALFFISFSNHHAFPSECIYAKLKNYSLTGPGVRCRGRQTLTWVTCL